MQFYLLVIFGWSPLYNELIRQELYHCSCKIDNSRCGPSGHGPQRLIRNSWPDKDQGARRQK